jgi:hypothetical protein
MRVRVDDGSGIRIAHASPGNGIGRVTVSGTPAEVTPPPPPSGNNYTPLPTPTDPGGSIGFSTSGPDTYVSIPASIDFRLAGNFTIEWWHRRLDTNSFPRVFAMGNYPTQKMGVSLEGGTFYFWTPGGPVNLGSYAANGLWGHYAVVRTGSTIRLYRDGVSTGTTGSYSGVVGSSDIGITIGNEASQSAGATFGGTITNFHIVNGTAKYSSNFSPPTGPTPGIAGYTGTKLLLWATQVGSMYLDGSDSGRTITGINYFSPTNPF